MGPLPRKAVVLAAGFGERMRPLSRIVPKPLLPVWGRPAVLRALDRLADWGVREVLVNLHYGADAVFDAVRRGAPAGVRVEFSFEPVLLGTGGALRRAAWFFAGDAPDRPFWLLNSDVAAAVAPEPLLRAFRWPRAIAALWMEAARGPRTVIARRGRVVDFRASRPGAPGTLTFCGLHLTSPLVLDYLPREERCCSIIEAYEAAMRDGRTVAAVESPAAWWADLGTPEDYLAAHGEIRAAARAGAPAGALYAPAVERRGRVLARAAGARARGFIAAAEGARIGRGAQIANAILLPGARVAARARVQGAVVGPGATASGAAARLVVRAADALAPAEAAALRRIAGARMEVASAEALAPRGSSREFLRLVWPGGRAMLVRYRPDRPENARYAGHARFLRRLGLPVPRVLADGPGERFTLFEDLGTRNLGDRVRNAPPERAGRLYIPVIAAVADWHERATLAARRCGLALEPAFGPEVFRYERDLFLHRFLAGHLGRPAAEVRRAAAELRGIAERLSSSAPTLLHRDLQSANILFHRGRPYFIDFQGMRFGPTMYDLASLLCDPYVEIPAVVRAQLLERYLARRPAAQAELDLFWPAAIQRLCQALGAYARMGALPGARRFLSHIPAAASRLREAIARSGLRLPALADAAEQAMRRVVTIPLTPEDPPSARSAKSQKAPPKRCGRGQ